MDVTTLLQMLAVLGALAGAAALGKSVGQPAPVPVPVRKRRR